MNDLFLWMDGEYLRLKAARTQVLAHGLHYGTGVFEGIRAYPTDTGPAVFRLDEHMARFQAGADALEMTVDTDALATATLELLRRNDQTAAYIRPLSYFESGGLGLDVAPLNPVLWSRPCLGRAIWARPGTPGPEAVSLIVPPHIGSVCSTAQALRKLCKFHSGKARGDTRRR